jgi:hypothetical protein
MVKCGEGCVHDCQQCELNKFFSCHYCEQCLNGLHLDECLRCLQNTCQQICKLDDALCRSCGDCKACENCLQCVQHTCRECDCKKLDCICECIRHCDLKVCDDVCKAIGSVGGCICEVLDCLGKCCK